MSHTTEETRGPLFTGRDMVCIATGFVAVLLGAWAVSRGVKWLCRAWGCQSDVSSTWPLSMFSLRVPGVNTSWFSLAASAGILLLFFVLVHLRFRQTTGSLLRVVVVGLALVLGTNLIHGPRHGLEDPHRGEMQYYHDAEQITSAAEFLREFQALQPELSCHGRTHPPGAVLFVYALAHTFGHPAAVSVAIAVLGVVLSAGFFYGLLGDDFDGEMRRYLVLLLLVIPSVQIYYCATLDAIIAGCFLGVIMFFKQRNPALSISGTIALLFLAAFLTFGAVFLLPVLLGFEIITRRSAWKSAAAIAGVGAIFAVMYALCGFNYAASFRLASALENPHGFLLFAEPISYVMTRLENVADVLVYFGPFLLVLLVRGTRIAARTRGYSEPVILTCLGVSTLAGMFLAGAFRTGETARACLFIYPYLLLPVAAYLDRCGGRQSDRKLLLYLVFGQSLAMQTFAGYFW